VHGGPSIDVKPEMSGGGRGNGSARGDIKKRERGKVKRRNPLSQVVANEEDCWPHVREKSEESFCHVKGKRKKLQRTGKTWSKFGRRQAFSGKEGGNLFL